MIFSFATTAYAAIDEVTPEKRLAHSTSGITLGTQFISFDGKYLLYSDQNTGKGYAYNTVSETNQIFSVADDESEVDTSYMFNYFIDDDGDSHVVFHTEVTNKVVDPTIGLQTGSFLYDRNLTDGTTRELKTQSGQPVPYGDPVFFMSNDGKYVVFNTVAQLDLVNDQNHANVDATKDVNAYRLNLETGVYEIVGYEGIPIVEATAVMIDKVITSSIISSDGSKMPFAVISGPGEALYKWYDFDSQKVVDVATIIDGNDLVAAKISPDGSKILLTSQDSYVVEDTNGTLDLYYLEIDVNNFSASPIKLLTKNSSGIASGFNGTIGAAAFSPESD
jgi:hypothetical protein